MFSVNSVRELSCALCQVHLFQSRIDPLYIVQIPEIFWLRAAQTFAPRVGICNLNIVCNLRIVIWDFRSVSGKANRFYLNQLELTLTDPLATSLSAKALTRCVQEYDAHLSRI